MTIYISKYILFYRYNYYTCVLIRILMECILLNVIMYENVFIMTVNTAPVRALVKNSARITNHGYPR